MSHGAYMPKEPEHQGCSHCWHETKVEMERSTSVPSVYGPSDSYTVTMTKIVCCHCGETH